MPSPGQKLKGLFHRHRKSQDETHSSPTKPRQSSNLSSHRTSNVDSVPYESASQGQAPRRGDRPLSNDSSPDASRMRSSVDQRTSIDQRNSVPKSAGRQDLRLNEVKRDDELSRGFNNLSVADRNNDPTSPARKSSDVFDRSQFASLTQPDQAGQPGQGGEGRYSENVADWNLANSQNDVAASRNSGKASGQQRSNHKYTLSREPSSPESRKSSVSRKPIGGALGQPRTSTSSDGSRNYPSHARAASLDKPLPPAPAPRGVAQEPLETIDDISGSRVLDDRRLAVRDAAEAPSLEGVVDLTNTEDTTVKEHWAPAVTHETVHQDIHHIREERVDREIHTHDVYHRILPIVDVEVLPARHFVPTEDGQYVEISASEIPGRTGDNQPWVIAETVSKAPSTATPRQGPRQFTAARFENGEGDYKEYTTEDGVKRTEQTWVHPPELEEGGYLTGQTLPFHFGSDNPADDGLRAKLPTGQVIGSSTVKAAERRALEGQDGSLRVGTQESEDQRLPETDGSAPQLPPLDLGHEEQRSQRLTDGAPIQPAQQLRSPGNRNGLVMTPPKSSLPGSFHTEEIGKAI